MHWTEIPGWFNWRDGQEAAVAHFGDGSRFVEVGAYLGRSAASLAEVVQASGANISVTTIDTCRGSGPEGPQGKDYHGAAVADGGGTFAGTLHRHLIACGADSTVAVLIGTSLAAAELFPDGWFEWVHLDARHDYDSVRDDIGAWLPKVRPGGWLTGDDFDPVKWPDVVQAVGELLPGATPWCNGQWRWELPPAPPRSAGVRPAWARRLRGRPRPPR